MSAAAGVVWTAGVGEQVTAGQPLLELQTDDPARIPRALEALEGADRRRHRDERAAVPTDRCDRIARGHEPSASGRRAAPALEARQGRRGRLVPRDQYVRRPLRDGVERGPLDPDAAISIRGLGKRYGEFVAVDGLDLDIRRGEIFALLGPNGAGKTTTIEICEGYRQRDAGEVRVLGEDPAARRPPLEGAAGDRAPVRLRRQPADRARDAAGAGLATTPTPATPTRCSSSSA